MGTLSLLTAGFLALSAPSGRWVPVKAEQLEFNYITNEGPIYLDCVHKVLPIEPDFYQVICSNGVLTKRFEAKFRVRQLAGSPRPTYELILWVTDRNFSQRLDYNSTVWIRLAEGQLIDVVMHQDVENTYAALEVRYRAE
jgi:hypothetical protein